MDWININEESPIERSKVFAYNAHEQDEELQFFAGWWYEDENCINEDKECGGYKYAFTHWYYPEKP